MKVLFAVSECIPFVKSGGLADVAGSLPKELKKLGTDVRVMLPKYGTISDDLKSRFKKIAEFSVQVGWRNQYCGIEEGIVDGITYYLVDNEYYFKRDRLYGHYDDGERFAYFSRAVLESLAHLKFIPNVIHCHDWHTAMVPFLLKVDYQYRNSQYGRIRSVFTIHNLQFQGIYDKDVISDLLGLDDRYFNSDQLEFHGNVNFMKGAIVAADKITTVSPTYKQEIQNEFFGEKLDGLLRKRAYDLEGILNGIDDQFYNPTKDPFLSNRYDTTNLQKKLANKKEMQKLFGLPVDPNIPLVVMITRLTKQKGLDLVQRVFHEMMSDGIQMIVLGTGDAHFEHFFREMAYYYRNQFNVHIGFDEALAHQVYAAADMFLMPSLFEPCGLGQLIALRYGAIPIVREVGGLNDTVRPYNEFTDEGFGFTFSHFNAHDMLYTIRRALHFYEDKKVWDKLVKKAMELDNSWAQSAFKYNQLYADIISRSVSHVF